jgi:hypothetical protein
MYRASLPSSFDRNAALLYVMKIILLKNYKTFLGYLTTPFTEKVDLLIALRIYIPDDPGSNPIRDTG